MNKLIVKLLLAIAAATLAACSTYQNVVPDWMPGSGAIKVQGNEGKLEELMSYLTTSISGA